MLTANIADAFKRGGYNRRAKPSEAPMDHNVVIYCIHDIVFCTHGATTIAKLADSNMIRLRTTYNERYGRTRYWAEFGHTGTGWIIYQLDYDMLKSYFDHDNDPAMIIDHTHDRMKAG